MIDKAVFAREFGVWEDRFNREHSDATMIKWWKTLSEHMDTETFERASDYVFEHNTYFPSPDEVIEAAERIERARDHLKTVEYLERRNERIQEEMSRQGRELLLEAGDGDREAGVEQLKEYLRKHAAVPLEERDRIKGESSEERKIGPGE